MVRRYDFFVRNRLFAYPDLIVEKLLKVEVPNTAPLDMWKISFKGVLKARTTKREYTRVGVTLVYNAALCPSVSRGL